MVNAWGRWQGTLQEAFENEESITDLLHEIAQRYEILVGNTGPRMTTAAHWVQYGYESGLDNLSDAKDDAQEWMLKLAEVVDWFENRPTSNGSRG